jgi:LmbE family N-acetylglucosaminyl deacetylase
MAEISLLGVFAHPDDEQTMSGAFARAAAEGIKTGLVCATRGELGEIADPALATPDNLGAVREAELRAACAVLGIKYLWFLDYRDSGMMGTPGNEDPASFYKVNDDEALARLVKIVREFRPTAMVTFDETGGYGHPDHLTIYRLTTSAFHAAADPNLYPEAGPPWQTGRLFYSSFPRGSFRAMGEWLREEGIASVFEGLDLDKMGMPDELITNTIDVSEWVHLKERSLSMHRTQLSPDSPFNKISPEVIKEWRSKEHYVLAAGTPLPDTADAPSDLFAGLREQG